MATPHKCPICEGRGTVPVDFYAEQEVYASRQICKACGGSGLVWEAATPSCPPYKPIGPGRIEWGPTWGYIEAKSTGLMFNS
jgi:hypothetical protein